MSLFSLQVPVRKIFLYTGVQLLCLLILFGIKLTYAAPLFPFFFICMVAIRKYMARFFSPEELEEVRFHFSGFRFSGVWLLAFQECFLYIYSVILFPMNPMAFRMQHNARTIPVPQTRNITDVSGIYLSSKLCFDAGFRPETSVIFLLCGTGIILVLQSSGDFQGRSGGGGPLVKIILYVAGGLSPPANNLALIVLLKVSKLSKV